MAKPVPDDTAALAISLSDELLDRSRRASASGLYEVAYHSLAGALHGAEEAFDGDRLLAIQTEARRQQNEVDSLAPSHRLSRQAGELRGHAGWFDALASQVTVVMNRLRLASARERS